ncbi:MAG TPA: murein biosynthesis integral membrane protein MurJ [Candidatus Nitrosocosmicus sp.]|nr:murein biosynthesis integral membrane protein MurJ [Candidatus Nitrosocosmicus sp.]
MVKFLSTTKRVIFARQKDILSSALILALMIVVSRLFGFLRYRTLATYFSKEELDIFLASFRLPDFVFEVLVSGALTAAFIPIFIKYEKNSKELHNNISSIINFIMLGLTAFLVVIYLLSGFIIPLITPGMSESDIDTIIKLSRVLLIGQLPILVVGHILSGVAQANKIFIITAIAPILYNLGIILGTILFAPTLGLYGPVIGVVLGSVFFLISQIPIIFITKFKYYLYSFNKKILHEFVTLFLPRFFSVITAQIDLTIDMSLSTLLGPGSYTIFFFAQHLQFFPVAFIGMAFGQASLPYLSDLYKEKKIEDLKKLFIDSCLQLLFLTVPLAIFFIFARTPIVRFFFGGEKFDWEGTVLTAKTMSYFALSIPLHTLFYFITRAFYATFDTKTPFIINVASIAVNTLLSLLFIFVFHLPVWSLAIAFSISISINVIVLFILFYKKIGTFSLKRLFFNTFKICIASGVSALLSYPIMKLFDVLILDTSRTINIFFLISIVFGIYMSVYLFLAWLINIEEIYILKSVLGKIKQTKKDNVEINTNIT